MLSHKSTWSESRIRWSVCKSANHPGHISPSWPCFTTGCKIDGGVADIVRCQNCLGLGHGMNDFMVVQDIKRNNWQLAVVSSHFSTDYPTLSICPFKEMYICTSICSPSLYIHKKQVEIKYVINMCQQTWPYIHVNTTTFA